MLNQSRARPAIACLKTENESNFGFSTFCCAFCCKLFLPLFKIRFYHFVFRIALQLASARGTGLFGEVLAMRLTGPMSRTEAKCFKVRTYQK